MTVNRLHKPSTNARCIFGFPTSLALGCPIDVHLKAALGHLLSPPNRADTSRPWTLQKWADIECFTQEGWKKK